jgi:hypothetical protein
MNVERPGWSVLPGRRPAEAVLRAAFRLQHAVPCELARLLNRLARCGEPARRLEFIEARASAIESDAIDAGPSLLAEDGLG